jgi:hypothetical protein
MPTYSYFRSNPAVMIEIDLEKKIKPLLENIKNYCISYQTLTTEDKKLIVRLLMWQMRIKNSEENQVPISSTLLQ